jgi:hypothetical protein
MIDWRTLLQAPAHTQNTQKSGPEGNFAHIADIADGNSTSALPSHEPVTQPAPPLQPGWFVTYTDRQGRLCGGWDDRQKPTVTHCVWSERGWSVHLSDGQAVPLAAVRCIGQTDEQGALKAAWSVREHGLDGTKNQA